LHEGFGRDPVYGTLTDEPALFALGFKAAKSGMSAISEKTPAAE